MHRCIQTNVCLACLALYTHPSVHPSAHTYLCAYVHTYTDMRTRIVRASGHPSPTLRRGETVRCLVIISRCSSIRSTFCCFRVDAHEPENPRLTLQVAQTSEKFELCICTHFVLAEVRVATGPSCSLANRKSHESPDRSRICRTCTCDS